MELLNGKVKVRSLLVTEKPAERRDVQARLLSPGGELAVLSDGVNAIRHLGYVELKEGKARGNHFHKLRHESFYIIAGEIDMHLFDLASGDRTTVRMRPGDLAEIGPNVVHTYVPTASGHAIEFAPETFDAADVYRQVIV